MSAALPELPVTAARRLRGFTLVELMVVLAALAVVTAMAGPPMADFAANNQVVAAKSSFAGVLALARTEAAKRGSTVFVQALGSAPVGDEYLNGWEIVVDDNGDGVAAATETRIRRSSAVLDKVKLSGPASIAFRASGALVGTAAMVFTVCRVSGSARGYSVTVTPSGATDVAAISSCT